MFCFVRLESVISKGLKVDPRFLDRSEKVEHGAMDQKLAIARKSRTILKNGSCLSSGLVTLCSVSRVHLLLATFKAECGELKEAEPHIARVEAIFVGLDKALAAVNGQVFLMGAEGVAHG